MSATDSQPPSQTADHLQASCIHLQVTWWWSRRDDFANYELAKIFARHGYPCADITSPADIDMSLRAAVRNEAALIALLAWIEMTSTRRKGSGIQNLLHSLPQLTEKLIEKLIERPLTATALLECSQQIEYTDVTIQEGQRLPELAHPSKVMTELLQRYNEVREVVFAAMLTKS